MEHTTLREWHNLLMNLKCTVDGLLATHSVNVWNTYGGLERLCTNLERILSHKLRVTQGEHGSCLDYWSFIRSLRWLKPVLAPSIEHINKLASGGGDVTHGRHWLKQSLTDHNVSNQLTVLVSNREHLMEHYYNDAFLCQPEYFQALVICLQAVEQNRAALLAEINPSLLQPHLSRASHTRSSSLPIAAPNDEMFRSLRNDPLAPRYNGSPKSESVLNTSYEHAQPVNFGTSPDSPTAKDALLQVLAKSGAALDYNKDQNYTKTDSDPLMNMQITPNSQYSSGQSRKPSRTSSLKNLQLYTKHPSDSSLSRGSSKENIAPGRKSSILLDKILNEDTECHDTGDSLSRNSGSLPDVSNRAISDNVLNPGHKLTERTDSGVSLDDASPKNKQSVEKSTHHRSKSDYGVQRLTGSAQLSLPESRSTTFPEKQSLFDEGGSGSMVTPATECFFPRPAEGQSLVSFLSSQNFRQCAELDRENAHFSVSEALIAAIEQMKWNQSISPSREAEDESDEEIQELKQRIRIRRTQRLKEKARGFPAFTEGGLDAGVYIESSSSAGVVDAYSSSPSEEYIDTGSESSSDDIDDQAVSDVDKTDCNLTSMKEGGLSLSMASLYSEAEFFGKKCVEASTEQSTGDSSMNISAEAVAISLLKKFSEHQLPKASDLRWLVSEQDAPQALLPLPTSYPVSPDDSENADLVRGTKVTRIRGNLEWAPPRAQIIFNVHPPPKRKVILAKQSYRCAGCGSKVDPGYVKKYRYCEYLGKYFCPCCHSNQTEYIPAKILKKWDFYRYPVSNFSRDLLKKIQDDPLFNINDISPGLYRKVRVLETLREYRKQLLHLQLFLRSCRLGESLRDELKRCPAHWVAEPHVYTLGELVRIKQGELQQTVKQLVLQATSHVQQCPLCQAKGFICEMCNNDRDIIFPYEFNRVTQCPKCRSCYHKTCFTADTCPKCARLELRRSQLSRVLSSDSNSDS